MKVIKLNKGFETMVDDEDYDRLSKFTWYVVEKSNGFYVGRTVWIGRIDGKKKSKRVYMHREIMSCTDDKVVDHIDNNPLNHQKINLRICTKSQNSRNSSSRRGSSSKYLGVSWDKFNNKWRAAINLGNKKNKKLGRFVSEEEAAIAYDKAALEIHGEFANLNFKNENNESI